MFVNTTAVNLGNNNPHLLAYLRSTFNPVYYFGLSNEATKLVGGHGLNVGCVIPTLPQSLDSFNLRPLVVFIDFKIVPKEVILNTGIFFQKYSPLLTIHVNCLSKEWDEIIKYLETTHDYRIGDSLGDDYLLYRKDTESLYNKGVYRKYQEFIF